MKIANPSKHIWLKIIAALIINSFLLLDITWAGGLELFSSKQANCLSPSIQISNQALSNDFKSICLQNTLYFVKNPTEIKSGQTSKTLAQTITKNESSFLAHLNKLLKSKYSLALLVSGTVFIGGHQILAALIILSASIGVFSSIVVLSTLLGKNTTGSLPATRITVIATTLMYILLQGASFLPNSLRVNLIDGINIHSAYAEETVASEQRTLSLLNSNDYSKKRAAFRKLQSSKFITKNIVETLLEMMLSEDQPTPIYNIIRHTFLIYGDKAIPYLMELTNRWNWKIRTGAIMYLSELGHTPIFKKTKKQLLKTPSNKIEHKVLAVSIAMLMAKMKKTDEAVMEHLMNMFLSDDEELQRGAKNSFRVLGDLALPQLQKLLTDKNSEAIRVKTAYFLYSGNYSAQIEPVWQLVLKQETNLEIINLAVGGLELVAKESKNISVESIDILNNLAIKKDIDTELLEGVINALISITKHVSNQEVKQSAISGLIANFNNKSQPIAIMAAVGLGYLQYEPAAKKLLQIINEPLSDYYLIQALDAFGECRIVTEDGIAALKHYLDYPNGEDHLFVEGAAIALGKWGLTRPDIEDALLAQINHTVLTTTKTLIWALGEVGDIKAKNKLQDIEKDPFHALTYPVLSLWKDVESALKRIEERTKNKKLQHPARQMIINIKDKILQPITDFNAPQILSINHAI